MSTEKVWDRIASDPENRIFRTLDSSWFIDNGVKIERFDKDGSVRIMNTMTASDFYEPITSEQSLFFENIGWEAGCLKANIDVCDRKLGIINNMIRISEFNPDSYDIESLKRRSLKLSEKKETFFRRLEKILKSL